MKTEPLGAGVADYGSEGEWFESARARFPLLRNADRRMPLLFSELSQEPPSAGQSSPAIVICAGSDTCATDPRSALIASATAPLLVAVSS